MPAIKSTSCEENKLTVVDQDSTYVFDASDIPVDKTTIQEVEDYINNEWLPENCNGDYQIKVHIFTVSPLVLTVWTADLDVVCPSNWWE